jgi:hypothetical protein
LELITNIPFVLRNNVVTGLPIEDPNQRPTYQIVIELKGRFALQSESDLLSVRRDIPAASFSAPGLGELRHDDSPA